MGFKYHLQDGIEYASYARSVRNGKKVVTEYTYLGKVIDKQKGLFFNRKLGYIVFDTDEKRIMPAPNGLVPSDSLEDESAILDFGDSFFLDEYMESQGINRCIGSMGCTETDMLCTLIVYYTLTHKKVDRIKRWYDGNYISQLHPGLDLRPERIVEFMNQLGKEESLRRFLDSYFELVTGTDIRRCGENDTDITIALGDRNALPETELPMSSEYRGMPNKGRDLRLVVVFHKDTHIPVYFRYVPNRLLKMSTLSSVNSRMESLGIGADFTVMDSEYCSMENISKMCENGIQFTMMVPEGDARHGELMGILNENPGDTTVYERDNMEFRVSAGELKLENGQVCHLYSVTLPETARSGGESKVKLIMSSNEIGSEEAVSICYVRNFTDRFLTATDTYIEDNGRITPESIRGHLMVSFAAASLIQMLRNDMDEHGMDAMDAYDMMKNQKCKVFETRIVPTRPSEELLEMYRSFGMECPSVIPRRIP